MHDREKRCYHQFFNNRKGDNFMCSTIPVIIQHGNLYQAFFFEPEILVFHQRGLFEQDESAHQKKYADTQLGCHCYFAEPTFPMRRNPSGY